MEVPYLNDDDSVSDSESKSNESDIDTSLSDAEYPSVTLVLSDSSRSSPMDKLRNKTPLQFSITASENSDSVNLNRTDSVDASHSINGELEKL